MEGGKGQVGVPASRSRALPNIIVGAAIVVVVVVALALLAIGGRCADDGGNNAAAGGAGSGGLVARVHDGDGAVHELPLSEDAELVVSTSLGTNVVVVERGAVFVRDADCANGDCIRQGAVSAPGRQIICLPHELWIEVVHTGDASGQMDEQLVAGELAPSGAADDDAGEGVDVIAR